jgi:hypothetical protein
MTNKTKIQELSQDWISFGKELIQEEMPQKFTAITEAQWNWFGQTMAKIKMYDQFSEPSGTECRSWPRAFAFIATGGNDFVNKFLCKWATQSHEEYKEGVVFGAGHIYDLIGYGVQPLFN